MSPESEQLVCESWERMQPQLDAVVHSFYERLFAQSPGAAELFAGTNMAELRRKFAIMLHEIVRALDRPQVLIPEVADSGRRHAGYGVQNRHYPDVRAALLSAMGEAPGENESGATIAAWREAYDVVAAVMQRASSTQSAAL